MPNRTDTVGTQLASSVLHLVLLRRSSKTRCYHAVAGQKSVPQAKQVVYSASSPGARCAGQEWGAVDTYLITGGAGFIGSHLAQTLQAAGHRVRVLDNFATGRRANLALFAEDIEIVDGDIRDADAVRRAIVGCEIVLHQAALASVQRSIDDPQLSHDVNVNGTLNVLLAARDAGVRRVVVASSSSVYGDTPTLPKVETMPPEPLSPYAASKLAVEAYGRAFAAAYDLPVIALRYFNVFGPRQDPNSEYSAVIPRFVTRMLAGTAPLIYGDGMQSRDFTFVQTVVEANLAAAVAPAALSGSFNVATGEQITLLDLLEALNELLGTEFTAEHAPARPGEVRHSLGDARALRETLGVRTHVPFIDGLAQTVAAYRSLY